MGLKLGIYNWPPVLGAKKKMGLGQTLTASLLFSLPETEGRLVPG